MNVPVPFAKTFLASLTTMVSASVIDGAVQRKMCGRVVVNTGKRILLVISNEDMNDIITITKWWENLGILMDGFSETVKHEKVEKVNWKSYNESWKRSCKSRNKI